MVEEEGAAAGMAGFDIRHMTQDDLESILRLLTETFGPGFDHDWFSWKHESGPWGPSPGWVAHDGSGLVGVRLFLPWRFQRGGDLFRAMRPCDTATSLAARGRGVFSALTRHAISTFHDVDFLFNTPNSNSRPGYLKMEFLDWGEIRQRVAVIWPRRVALTDDPEPPSGRTEFVTRTDRAFLQWRYYECPVHEYSSFGLEGETGCGLICRIRDWRGMRLLVVSELWGNSRQQADLVKGATAELGGRLAWFAEPFPLAGVPSVSRSGTIVTRYDLRVPVNDPPSLSLGDVEDVL